LILIDEWVAYARQLYGIDGLPAGSFDAQFTFAQALAEAARAVPGVLLVVSIPASDIEVGGEGGQAALERLKNVVARMESSWRPASADEGFEIVRRRLFEDVPADKAAERDAVVRDFANLYRTQAAEVPSPCREADYERRIAAAYPIHPELFDRLYNEWSTLDKFQRTRGVLRLMAGVIHELWERQDGSLLIMPASVPDRLPFGGFGADALPRRRLASSHRTRCRRSKLAAAAAGSREPQSRPLLGDPSRSSSDLYGVGADPAVVQSRDRRSLDQAGMRSAG
jgi:predicted AAA+ superfamily ATPase